MSEPPNTITRRDFSRRSAYGAGILIAPGLALGKDAVAANDKLNVACIGCGGKGESDVHNVSGERIVALCDVDEARAAKTFAKHPSVRKFKDYRRLFDAMGNDIDAVTITTPDHMHFPIAMAAIELGKHVFVQKPMAQTVWQARQMTLAARRQKVATQMGIQGHASRETRLIAEWIADGAIGEVREVQCWTMKPGRTWRQGLDAPLPGQPVPGTLDWNLWLGVAPERPYNRGYAPFAWRGWWDFGSCALGDMGCHVLDHPVRALRLGMPTSVEAYATPFSDQTGPLASTIHYDFPARDNLPPVRLSWYDGGIMPPWPSELASDRRRGNNEGCLFIGSRGKLMCGCYGNEPRLIPESAMTAYERPPKTIPRSPGLVEEWLAACKGGAPATANFDYSGPLTEIVQLGNIALRAASANGARGHDGRMQWDAATLNSPNLPNAARFVKGYDFRKF